MGLVIGFGIGLVLLLLIVTTFLFFTRSGDEVDFDRGDEGFSDKYGRGFRDDSSTRAADSRRDAVSQVAEPRAQVVAIDHVQQGDCVEISESVGGQWNITFHVRGINRYETNQGIWMEYYGSQHGRTVCLEVFPDAGATLGVVFSDETATLEQIGLTEDDLIRWDEGDADRRSFDYDGESWAFEWSGETSSRAANSTVQDNYYGWDFVGRSGLRALSIEKREEYPFEVCLVHLIDRGRIHVTRD